MLETGRTHQIRAHMKHIGHPLFADETLRRRSNFCGERAVPNYTAFVRNCMSVCPRQALHARTLGFRHPATGEEMDFEAPWPADFSALIERWRTYTAHLISR